jgi:hypothetical protein
MVMMQVKKSDFDQMHSMLTVKFDKGDLHQGRVYELHISSTRLTNDVHLSLSLSLSLYLYHRQ